MTEHNPLNVMHHEHDVICSTEEVVESLKDLWLTDEAGYKNTVDILIVFFREYADGYHHRKEEDVLFTSMRESLDFTLYEMLDEFEDHHVSFRDYTIEIEEAIKNKEFKKSYDTLYAYLQDMLDHIAAENGELFVTLDSILEDESREIMYFHFKDIDLELGEDRKKELEESISKILA